MRFDSDSLGLAGSVTTILRDLIHERLGLSFEPSQFDQLADRLAPLVVSRGLGSFMDYYYALKYSDDPADWTDVMDALAVQETYFWREIDQIRAVVEEVIPDLIERRRGRPLTIWSVPCATGEEPLTIAMLLEEHGWFERAPIEIVASDASPMAIAKARVGWYGRRAFRNLPAPLRDKYFTSDDGKSWQVAPSIASRVSYDVVNVMDGHAVAWHATAPVIFCRNLFIYFSQQSIQRAVDAFVKSMPDPGFLCIGAAESLLRQSTPFELAEIGGAFIYTKGHAAPGSAVAAYSSSPERT